MGFSARKRWVVLPCDKPLAQEIAEECGMDPLPALLLTARGYTDPVDIDGFLNPDGWLANPFELADMTKAVERIHRAVEAFEPIAVFGDYDADGITATCLLYQYLAQKGAKITYYIPDRLSEGYGMHKESIDRLHEAGTSLIVTVDNGIAAVEETAYAASLGMDVVVTDHHIPGPVLPSAVAVVNPHRQDSGVEFRDLAGVGVAFKLVCALEGGGYEEMLERYADLVALGTVADVVPLTGENRVFVRRGLQKLTNNPSTGLRAVMEVAGIAGRAVTAESLAFVVAPRINAAGRMGRADRAAALLLCEDTQEAAELAADVHEANRMRQQTELTVLNQACQKLREDTEATFSEVLVVWGKGWHNGVVGIVASRLAERYGRPAVVLSVEDGQAKGSARSVGELDIFQAISACADVLDAFGGHRLAAGMSLPANRLEEFSKQINRFVREQGGTPVPELKLDCKLNPRGVTLDTAQELSMLEPFGCGNPSPLFGLFNMRLDQITAVGGGRHLRLGVSRDQLPVTAMLFSTTLTEFPYREGDTVDLAASLSVTSFNGRPQLSVVVRDIRPSGEDEERLFSDRELYGVYRQNQSLTPGQYRRLTPAREDIAAVYRCLRQEKPFQYSLEILYYRMGFSVNYAKMRCALDILEELDLIAMDCDGEFALIRLTEATGRRELSDSTILCFLEEKGKGDGGNE